MPYPIIRIHNSSHPADIQYTQIGTVYTPNPCQGNSYSNCINRERRGRNSGIIIIRMRPIRDYVPYIHAVPMTRQQLQQLHHPREKRRVQWYYCRSYGSYWKIYYSSHPKYNSDSDVTILRMVLVIYTNMPPSYKTINSITQFYVYTGDHHNNP